MGTERFENMVMVEALKARLNSGNTSDMYTSDRKGTVIYAGNTE